MRDQLDDRLCVLTDYISEYTFANLYLFRKQYDYKVGYTEDNCIVIFGNEKSGRRFAMLPERLPEGDSALRAILSECDYIKGAPQRIVDQEFERLERLGFSIEEDRDNFDYIYSRDLLANLSGRLYHKKRNQVNVFINNYKYKEEPLSFDNISGAFEVLKQWHADQDGDGDYYSALEALENIETLQQCGYLVTVDDVPAAFILGESLDRGSVFLVHFEKAIVAYKGVYQFLNKAFATILPKHYTLINREQDLGDPGLRQAKMTYRPVDFIKKYKIISNRAYDT